MAPRLSARRRQVFPFFTLPHELRDIIYQACDGDEAVRPSGPKDKYLHAWVEGGLRTNLLLISKQFSSEYQEWQSARATLIIDMTLETRKYFGDEGALLELKARAKKLGNRSLTCPRRIDAIEVRLPIVAGAIDASLTFNRNALANLVEDLSTSRKIPATMKLYIQTVGWHRKAAPTYLACINKDNGIALREDGMKYLRALPGVVRVELYFQTRTDLCPAWQGSKDGFVLKGTWSKGGNWVAVG